MGIEVKSTWGVDPLGDTAEFFKILGDRTRLQIFLMLLKPGEKNLRLGLEQRF